MNVEGVRTVGNLLAPAIGLIPALATAATWRDRGDHREANGTEHGAATARGSREYSDEGAAVGESDHLVRVVRFRKWFR